MVTEGAKAIIGNEELQTLLAAKNSKIRQLNSVIEDTLNALMVQIFGEEQLLRGAPYHARPGTEALVQLAIDINLSTYGEIRCSPLLSFEAEMRALRREAREIADDEEVA